MLNKKLKKVSRGEVNMEEQSLYELASEIANRVSNNRKSVEDSRRLIQLIKELLEVRWSLSLGQSA